MFDIQAESAKEAEEKIFQKHFKEDWRSNKIWDVTFEVEEVTGELDLFLAEFIKAGEVKFRAKEEDKAREIQRN